MFFLCCPSFFHPFTGFLVTTCAIKAFLASQPALDGECVIIMWHNEGDVTANNIYLPNTYFIPQGLLHFMHPLSQ